MLGVFGLVTENEEFAQLVADSQRDDDLVDLVNHAMNVIADDHSYHYVHMFVGRKFDQQVELLDDLKHPVKREVVEVMINGSMRTANELYGEPKVLISASIICGCFF